MTQKDPNSRLTVSEYLDILQGKTSLLDPAAALSNIASAKEPPTTLLPSAPNSLASSPVTGSILTEGIVLPPRPPAVSVSSAAQIALTVFPGYFDAGLYPLFLKMHWNGVTPDDRVNLICQVIDHLIFTINFIHFAGLNCRKYICRNFFFQFLPFISTNLIYLFCRVTGS